MSARAAFHGLVAVLLVAAAGVSAQDASPAPPPAADVANQGVPPPADETPDLIKSIIEQEIQPAPGAYTYVPANRRDPFVSLSPFPDGTTTVGGTAYTNNFPNPGNVTLSPAASASW